MAHPDTTLLHATTVAWGSDGVIILGAAGSGKSSLALDLMALGCVLVADDRTQVTRTGEELVAEPPRSIAGLIEARGIGLLQTAFQASTTLSLIIDLDKTEGDRLPPLRQRDILGVSLPILHKVITSAWPAAICTYLSSQRIDPDEPHVR